MADEHGLEIEKGTPTSYQPRESRPLTPTVFVGLGGTGLKVLARFRRRIYDRYGDADYWKIYQWLGIDTDKGDLASGGKVGEKGLAIHEKDRLSTGLDANAMKDILENLRGLYGYIGEWFRLDALAENNRPSGYRFLEGAAQIRMAGRLLFIHSIEEIRKALISRLVSANSQSARADALAKGAQRFNADAGGTAARQSLTVDVVLVGSLAGGTGSGSFLDCAYLLQALKQERTAPVGEVRGMFLLPDVLLGEVSTAQEKQTIKANGYAALRELEYYNSGRGNAFSTLAWGPAGQLVRQLNDPPFQNCYLFSLSNGRPLENAREMYDLLADALAFSTGGGELAAKIRSCWSNAQGSVYNNRLVYRQYADGMTGKLHEAGGVGDGVSGGMNGGASAGVANDHRTILYERTWSTRYSSMGTASLTMKLPELQRLAAVRLVRRLLELEAAQIRARADSDLGALDRRAGTAGAGEGGDDEVIKQGVQQGAPPDQSLRPGAPRNVLKETTQDVDEFLGARDFLKQLPARVAERIENAAGSSKAKDAEDAARKLLTLLFQTATAVESDGPRAEGGDPQTRIMIAEVRGLATQAVGAAAKKWSADGSLTRLAARADRASKVLKDKVPQIKANDPGHSRLQLNSEALKQWQDLDANESGAIDLLFGGLDGRARRIIRASFRTWLKEQCDGYVKRIGAGLQRQYVLQLIADLNPAAARARGELQGLKQTIDAERLRVERTMKSEVAELEPWRAELHKRQNSLAQQFQETRNTIIPRVREMAATAEDSDRQKEQQLDVELNSVLDLPQFHGPHADDAERLTAFRAAALAQFAQAESLAVAPGTLLEARREHGATMGVNVVVEKVVDVSTRLLGEFPRVRDMFEALADRDVPALLNGDLATVMERAGAYWHLNTSSPRYGQTVQATKLSGTVRPPTLNYVAKNVLDHLQQKEWGFHSPDPDERGARGELVLVHEAHGFALQSLVGIEDWRHEYERMVAEGKQAARHLDARIIPLLPELTAVSFNNAMDEVESWDYALLGIVLGSFFKWSERQSSFMYNPTGASPMEVGPNYEEIAQWLRNAPRYRRRLVDDVDAWFTERAQVPGAVQGPAEKHAAAQREARQLVLLKLVLEVLARRCFKARQPNPKDLPVSPPPHTIITRLLETKVNRFIRILTNTYKDVDGKAIEKGLVGQIQRHVQFVGPKANGNGLAARSEGVRDRILQLRPDGKENDDAGHAILKEAFHEKWYPEADIPDNITSLVPDYGAFT